MTYPLAEAAQAESELRDAAAVRSWRASEGGAEPVLPDEALVAAIRARRSVRRFGSDPLPRDEVADLLAWSEGPIPADAPSVVTHSSPWPRSRVSSPVCTTRELKLIEARDEGELRAASGFAAMEQDHPAQAAFDVWQMADLEQVVADLGDRGYRWAQLEAGIRAGRLQIGAFMHGWGAAASTFYDEEVSKLLGTDLSPLLMVAIGPRAGRPG